MSNSTSTGHLHVPDSDGVIILILGALVFLTFALGLVSQLRETPLIPFLKRQTQYFDEEEGEVEFNHQMADLESQTQTHHSGPGQHQQDRPRPERPELELVSRPTTRYGSIQQHEVNVNGTRKLVLVVDAHRHGEQDGIGAEENGNGTPDGYSEWFERWMLRQGLGLGLGLGLVEGGESGSEGQVEGEAGEGLLEENEIEREGQSDPLLDFGEDQPHHVGNI